MVEDYADGAVGLQACLENPPELLLVDLQLPGKHGLDIVAELLQVHKNVKVLVLTGHAEPSLPGKLMRLGAAGFVDSTTAPLAYVIQAIYTVMAGGMFFASHVQAETNSIGGNLPLAGDIPPSDLSARELEVAQLVSAGRSSKKVASDLNLSTRSVENHRANIMENLGVWEVASLVPWVMQNGLG